MATLQEAVGSGHLPGTWDLAADRSTVTFGNRTFWGLANVAGTFSDVRGGGQWNLPNGIDGHLVITAASVDTGIRKRDEHLRSADFFDVQQHPTIGVVVGSGEITGPDTVVLHARLAVKGIERSLDLPATVSMLADGAVRIAADATINRQDFGIHGNLLGMIPDTTKVAADLVFVKAG